MIRKSKRQRAYPVAYSLKRPPHPRLPRFPDFKKSSSIARIDTELHRQLGRHPGVRGELLVRQLTLAPVTAEADLHDPPVAALLSDVDLLEVEAQGFPEETDDGALAHHGGVATDDQDAGAVGEALGGHDERRGSELDSSLEAGLVEQAVLHHHDQPPGRGPVPHDDAGRDAGGVGQQTPDDLQREHLAGVSDLAEQLVVGDRRGQARDPQHPVLGARDALVLDK